MVSIIIYATDKTYLDKTIDSILDTTPPSIVSEIIVCDDVGLGWVRAGIKVQITDRVGRSCAWNVAADGCVGETLVFVRDKTKFTPNWLFPLLTVLDCSPKTILSPIIHTLDLAMWATETACWRRFGWRWDFNVYDRAGDGSVDSPAVSDNCLVCAKSWFVELGGFDSGIGLGSGVGLELSLRSWLFGGSVGVCDGSVIAIALEVDYHPNTVNNFVDLVVLIGLV